MIDENMISLEAVSAFEAWMNELPKSNLYYTDFFMHGSRLRELAEEYDVENLEEVLYLLEQWFNNLEEEFITGGKRALAIEGFED